MLPHLRPSGRPGRPGGDGPGGHDRPGPGPGPQDGPPVPGAPGGSRIPPLEKPSSHRREGRRDQPRGARRGGERLMADLLFEIGCEELPARFIQPALESLRQDAAKSFQEHRLGVAELQVYGTPRRLALIARGLAERQEPRVWAVRGPAADAAFDAQARPTEAAEGCARARGVRVEDLVRETTEQGEYVFARVGEPALETDQVLPDLLRGLVEGLRFPKSMRWDETGFRFARPVRWLVAVYDGQPVPVEVAGVRPGTVTYGHRLFSPGPAEVAAPTYLQRLRER